MSDPVPMSPLTAPTRELPAVDKKSPNAEAAWKTAHEFEAVFLGQITKLMFENVEPGEFSGGHGEEIFRGVMAERIGDEIARTNGIGLAPAVFEQIIKMQEQGQ